MSHIVPASFDPFATHPFTNNSASLPQAPYPSPYPRHIPSSYNGVPTYSAQQQQQQQSATSSAQTPMHAPQPQRAPFNPASQQKHIFETFKLERSSPDLKDVLAKKSGSGTSSPAKPSRK